MSLLLALIAIAPLSRNLDDVSEPGNPLKLFVHFESDRRVRITAYPSGSAPIKKPFLEQFVNLNDSGPDVQHGIAIGELARGGSVHERTVLGKNLGVVVGSTSNGYVVTFKDRNGRTISSQPISIKDFKPTEIAGETSFHTSRKLAMEPGEAFFGLGGHQDGHLDYRGARETLIQDNRETALPFLLSSKGYAILDDLPDGQTVDFGGPASIPNSLLFDENGVQGGLTAHYYKGQNFDTFVGDKREVDLSFKQQPIADLGAYNYSIRYMGTFVAPVAGSYTFVERADDGARLFIDGQEVINDWRVKPASDDSATLPLTKGKHAIKIEYFQAGGGAEFSLKMRRPHENQEITWSHNFADTISFDFILGPKFDDIIAEYRKATGQAPMFAKWAYGFWQCKERYKSQQELLDIAKGFRDRQIPIDNIVQDWFYWDPYPWGSHQFDENRYPDIAGTVKVLHDHHIHIMLSVWAKFKQGSANFYELKEAGGLLPAFPGGFDDSDTRYYDPFNPKARKIYWDQIRRELVPDGFDAWWLDASEPEINMDEYAKAQTGAGLAARVLNAYPLMHTGTVYDGLRKAKPEKRVFILTRSAYLGQQRHSAATWSGDINGDWQTFANQIPSGLNFCLSGIPYWCTDIGGFNSRPNTNPDYKELFLRWYQYGTFCPIFRVHGTGTDKEPWRWGPDGEKIMLKFDKLRYRLLPYIYSVASQVTRHGYTMMRALAMDFRTDPKALAIKDEFMFGPAFLVAPVIKAGATSRSVYLPKGTWYDFWTNKTYKGGQSYEISAPMDSMPLFVRAGSIVPLGPDEQYASEKRGPIEARVYPGASGKFELYDDAGDGYGYEKGQFWTEVLGWDQKTKTLYTLKPHGGYPGMEGPLNVRFKLVKSPSK